MKHKFCFSDDDEVQYARSAFTEVDPEVLDHIIQQTATFKENMQVAHLVNEDQPFGCLPDAHPVTIQGMKEIFLQNAPDIIIQLAYRVKYLQEKLEK